MPTNKLTATTSGFFFADLPAPEPASTPKSVASTTTESSGLKRTKACGNLSGMFPEVETAARVGSTEECEAAATGPRA